MSAGSKPAPDPCRLKHGIRVRTLEGSDEPDPPAGRPGKPGPASGWRAVGAVEFDPARPALAGRAGVPG